MLNEKEEIENHNKTKLMDAGFPGRFASNSQSLFLSIH
jgi:hypothetical protein